MPLPSQTTPPDNGLYDFVRVIVTGDAATAARLLDHSGELRCLTYGVQSSALNWLQPAI